MITKRGYPKVNQWYRCKYCGKELIFTSKGWFRKVKDHFVSDAPNCARNWSRCMEEFGVDDKL